MFKSVSTSFAPSNDRSSIPLFEDRATSSMEVIGISRARHFLLRSSDDGTTFLEFKNDRKYGGVHKRVEVILKILLKEEEGRQATN